MKSLIFKLLWSNRCKLNKYKVVKVKTWRCALVDTVSDRKTVEFYIPFLDEE